MHFVWRLAILLMVGLAPWASSAREPLPRSVLYLDENDPGLPFAQGISAAFRAALNAAEVEIIDLTGLPMVELRKRVATLPEATVIYFTTLTFDGDRPAY